MRLDETQNCVRVTFRSFVSNRSSPSRITCRADLCCSPLGDLISGPRFRCDRSSSQQKPRRIRRARLPRHSQRLQPASSTQTAGTHLTDIGQLHTVFQGSSPVKCTGWRIGSKNLETFSNTETSLPDRGAGPRTKGIWKASIRSRTERRFSMIIVNSSLDISTTCHRHRTTIGRTCSWWKLSIRRCGGV